MTYQYILHKDFHFNVGYLYDFILLSCGIFSLVIFEYFIMKPERENRMITLDEFEFILESTKYANTINIFVLWIKFT